MTAARPVKRSVTIAGHRTSISLEAQFWQELRAAAVRRGLSLNQMVSQIDAERSEVEGAANLSAVLRVFVLREVKSPQ
ncbi:MAG: ribbon-helix-helix domain-containing protein [Candidatus Pacebacteria bacterium]|nr:ribbon-helix-helix domain-containing protein [Candidatus Paceibacterota bacterium]